MFACIDGPEAASISGPGIVKVGDNVTLTCFAPSNPPSSYKWLFNGSKVAETSTYVTPAFTTDTNRMYTCVAHNNVTGLYSTAHQMVISIGKGFSGFFCTVVVFGGHLYVSPANTAAWNVVSFQVR